MKKTKEEIRTKWIRHTPLLPLDECVDNAMEEYASQCQEDMAYKIKEAYEQGLEDGYACMPSTINPLNKQD